MWRNSCLGRTLGIVGRGRCPSLSPLRVSSPCFLWYTPRITLQSLQQSFLSTVAPSLRVAILGPVNAGKSTLFNRLVDKQANKSYRLTVDKKRGARRLPGRLKPGGRVGRGGGQALVSAVGGTTRDRRECLGRLGGTPFLLVDTAGIDRERLEHLNRTKHRDDQAQLQHDMMQQTLMATAQSDLVLLLFDGRVGVTSDLLETARWLRKMSGGKNRPNRRILLLANKLEGNTWDYDDSPISQHLHEATRLGFGPALPVSAQHGEGMAEIAVEMQTLMEERRRELGIETDSDEEDNDASVKEEEEKPLQLAILGRPNVGKSTLVNALLQEDRVLVGARPGLTRDAIAVAWRWQDRPVVLVDTAGIRKRSQRERLSTTVEEGTTLHSSTPRKKNKHQHHSNHTVVDMEDLAVQDALRALKVADVAVLVLDAGARMLHRQELAICQAVLQHGRSLVVAANKMDLIVDSRHTTYRSHRNDDDDESYSKEDFVAAVRDQLEGRFPMLRKTPIVAMSSWTGESVQDLMPVVFDARDRWARTLSTGLLNRWLHEVLDANPPPMSGSKRTKLKYIMQTKGRPPTFLLFGNTDHLPDHYLRYLTRNFQDTFGMYGMQVRLAVKKSAPENPFVSGTAGGGPNKHRGGYGLGGRAARTKRNVQQLKSGTPARNTRRSRQI